jgi:hypothetical protein
VSDVPTINFALFNGGPPHKLQRWIGLNPGGRPRVIRRALLAMAIMWLPLVVLAALHGDLIGRGTWDPFLFDFGAQTRFLIVPLVLIFSELVCLPRLAALAAQFLRGGLVRTSDYPRYQYAVSSTVRLMNSTSVEVIAVILAYALVAILFWVEPLSDIPHWHGVYTATGYALSPAGWWAKFVSLPLLLLLELGWLWRLCLWSRFLWLMNRLDLRLIASHPDHAGGLRFVQYSVRALLPLAFAFGVLAAGPILNAVVHLGISPLKFKYVIAGTAILAVIVLVGPLWIFMYRLIEEQRLGMFTYGSLALRQGAQLEGKWFRPEHTVGEEALSVSDFSSTTDLYSIVSNVYAMQIVPLELKNLLMLVVATLLPFIPVALLSAPMDVILQKLAALFF